MALTQAVSDGIDVTSVARRVTGETALLLDVVEDGGRHRLVESVPGPMLLTEDDVAAAAGLIASCQLLLLQLQQPGPAVRAALRHARAVVVADGAPSDDETRAALLARAQVLRADTDEAAQLAGRELRGADEVREAAAELLTAGPRLVSLGAGDEGTVVAWRAGPPLDVAADEQAADPRWADGELVIPLFGGPTVDATGAGDAYVAALAAALLGNAAPADAAWAAAAAAALTIGHPGGRPALTPAALADVLRRYRSE
jgi:ribokinase